MAQSTLSPNAAAQTLSKRLGRPITPKGVRNMARAIIGRFDKTKHPEYQSHAYTAAEMETLRKAFTARGQRAVAQPTRKASRKAAPKRAVKASTPVVES